MKKKLLVTLLCISTFFCLCSCGKDDTDKKLEEINQRAQEMEQKYADEGEEDITDKMTINEPLEEPVEEPPEASAIPIQCGDNINNDNFLMTFDSMELLSEYSYKTGEGSSMSLYLEDGYKFVIIKGHFENKSTTTISDNSFALSAVVNNTYIVDGYDVHIQFFRDEYFEIDAYTDLDYVLYIQIPEKLADTFETATFTLGFNDDLSTPSFTQNTDGTLAFETDNLYELTNSIPSDKADANVGNSENTTKTISIGETIATDNYDFTLTNVKLTYEVLPSNTSGVYFSYPAESGKVYIDVAADIKNTIQRNIRIDELFAATALYDNDYLYNGFTVVNNDNKFDSVGSYAAAVPLETCKAHNLIECPAEVDTSGKTIIVTLLLGDTSYEYTFR